MMFYQLLTSRLLPSNSAIEEVYMAFFYTDASYRLCQQSNETLFGCFMTTLNTAFEHKLALEDEGYKSGSENFNIPTPLRQVSKIHHVSSAENASFNPTPVAQWTSRDPCQGPHLKPIHRCLTYSSWDDTSDDEATISTTPVAATLSIYLLRKAIRLLLYTYKQDKEEEMEEDFQTVPLDDDHWTDSW